MKVLFLDIDGVLISERSFWQAQLCHKEQAVLDRRALLALKKLVEQTGAKVVITSSWRNLPDEPPSRPYLDLQTRLAHNGTPVYSQTPCLESNTLDRSDEIAAWLEEHPTEWFAVIDDNDRFANRPEIRARWIPVNCRYGLCMKNVEKAVALP